MIAENNKKPRFEDKRSDLQKLLRRHNIPIAMWGKGNSKTVADLTRETLSGESEITTTSEGELLRKTSVVGVDVFYKDKDGNILKLKEEKQVFKDGRERRRNMLTSISEKMKAGETPTFAASRALKEELGIVLTDEPLDAGDITTTIQESSSYPGLTASFTHYLFRTTIGDQKFNPEGYCEEQEDKFTFFSWEQYSV